MDGKEDAKEEAKGPSLSREDLLKYIKRLKTKVKGLEDDKVQSEKEADYLRKGYDSQRQAWEDLYAQVRACAEVVNGGAVGDSLDPMQMCTSIQTALKRSRPEDSERIKTLEQQNEELRLKCEAAVAVQLDLSTQLQLAIDAQQQQQHQQQQQDVHGLMESLMLELQRLDKWSASQQYMVQLRAVVNGDEVPSTMEQRSEREKHAEQVAEWTAKRQSLEAELAQARGAAEKWETEKTALTDQLSAMKEELGQLRDATPAYPGDLAPLPQQLPSELPALMQLLNREVEALRLADSSRFQSLLEQIQSVSTEQLQQLQQLTRQQQQQQQQSQQQEALSRVDSVSSMEGGSTLTRNASTDSLFASPTKNREGSDERQEWALKMKRLVARCKKLQEEAATASKTAADATQLAAEREQEIARLEATIVELREQQQQQPFQEQQNGDTMAQEVLDAHNNEVEQLRAKIHGLESELARANADHLRAQREVGLVSKQVKQLQDTIANQGETLRKTLDDTSGAQEQLAARDQEIARLQAALTELKDEHQRNSDDVSQRLAVSQAENQQLVESSKEKTERISTLTKQVEELQVALQTRTSELEQATARAQNMEGKAKRLKSLLANAHSAAQRKEAELENLRRAPDPPKYLRVKTVVQDGDDAWLLVVPVDEAGEPLPDEQQMWQTQVAVDQWQQNGTQVVGTIPESIQAKTASEIALAKEREQNTAAELAAMRTNLAEVEQAFEAYKSRAQAALKRVTREDSNLRKDQYEAEHAKLLALSEQVTQLTRTVESKSATIEEQNEELGMLRDELARLRNSVSETEAARDELADRVRELTGREASTSEKLSDLEARNAELMAQVDSLSACLREKEEELRIAMTQAVPVVSEVVHPPTPIELKKQDSQVRTPEPAPVSPPPSTDSNRPDTAAAATVEDSHSAVVPPSSVGGESLLLFDQARQDQEEVQDMMKARVQQLTAELVDVREQLVQLHEQNDVLRESIRELDGQLCRERELNSHDRRLNAEYLTNVVKSFLVCDDKDERLRLIPVICHILHFSAAEQQEILNKWSGARGGIAGWTSSLWGGKPKPDDGSKPKPSTQTKLDPTTLAGFELQI